MTDKAGIHLKRSCLGGSLTHDSLYIAHQKRGQKETVGHASCSRCHLPLCNCFLSPFLCGSTNRTTLDKCTALCVCLMCLFVYLSFSLCYNKVDTIPTSPYSNPDRLSPLVLVFCALPIPNHPHEATFEVTIWFLPTTTFPNSRVHFSAEHICPCSGGAAHRSNAHGV